MPAQGETHGVGNVSISMMPCPSRYRSGTAGAPKRQEGGTFTMTFADDGARGQGLLVPCRANFLDAAAVVVGAQELWRPGKRGAAGCSIFGAWGCGGLVFRDQPVPAPWLRTWAEHFHRNACPVPPVDADGLLGIPWPVMPACSPVSDVRVLLATATKADATRPSAEEIADAWVCQDQGHESYFFENVRYGIRTPEDRLIWQRIEKRRPRWLEGPAYGDAVAILRAE